MRLLPTTEQALAITMWDTGWLTRHFKYDSMEDWDKCLDELVERGYNAIRIDAFPHLVAADSQGRVSDSFLRVLGEGALYEPWRNQWSVYLSPRAGLLEFLPKCRERGVRVGLSTWYPDVANERHCDARGVDGFVRVWDETLQFLDEHGLADDLLYVDLLNEYPFAHNFQWLKNELENLREPHEPTWFWPEKKLRFLSDFSTSALARLKEKWPQLQFMFSFSYAGKMKDRMWSLLDLSEHQLLDCHMWAVNSPFGDESGYWVNLHKRRESDRDFCPGFRQLMDCWKEKKGEVEKWLHDLAADATAKAEEYDLPIGNTEGWGPIVWRDHPYLTWDFVKECGLIGARIGAELGYAFNCSSNFTHPHFSGLWADVDYHREVTGIIKGT